MNPVKDAMFILQTHLGKEYPNLEPPTEDEIFLVYFSYIIGGWKCELATGAHPGFLYQITHNVQFVENYLDVYQKRSNSVYIDDGLVMKEISSKEAPSRPDVDIPICPACDKPAVWSQGRFVCNNHFTTREIK